LRPESPFDQRLIQACSQPSDAVLATLLTRETGLTAEEIEERISEYGRNVVYTKHKAGFWIEILERVKNPLVIQLLVICLISLVMQDLRSVIVIGGMIFLSVFLAYFQEKRSDRAVEQLQSMVQTTSVVIREGKEQQIQISEIVPGDIISLAAGSIIPADCRLLSAKDFFVSQSALTGESIPLEKNPAPASGNIKSTFELANACFQGSNVVSGTARAVAVNTGTRTVLGGISQNLSGAKDTTNFDQGVKAFVWLMVKFMVVMVGVTFLIVGFTKHDWLMALMFGISVAVGLTPEMLPMIITVCLATGAMRLSKKKVVVKKLKAIQNFGAMDILCTDKTGTLTQDNIVLERYVDVTNRASEDVLRYAYMNSHYQTGLRNLLDKAILAHEDLDIEKNCRKVDEIPFDFIRKRMSVIIDYEDRHVLICKGAVEEIFTVCDQYQIDDEIYSLIDMLKNDLIEEYHELSSQGYRVLAVAYREFPKTQEVFSVQDEREMVLLGYIAFFDPPKDSAAKAITALKKSGVTVKILTGDNDLVTRKVCKEVGIDHTEVITGGMLQDATSDEFMRYIKEHDVFARLTPSQKEKIIFSLRSAGHVVGFLGDGINDAPAMKAADVGISVDTAVDIAKESADIILLEKSLMVLEDGILEGRKIFANILKYIKMGASSNFGNMFSVVGGSYFLPFLPMLPIQVLANNLLYDISQVGIPTDNVDVEFVEKPHRWNISFIRKFMIFIGPMSSIFDYATFFLMLYGFNCILFVNGTTSPAMKLYYEKLFHTGWFVESIFTQTLIVHIIRTNRIPFFQSLASPALTASTLGIMGTAALLPYIPWTANLLGLVPLPSVYWIWIAAFLLTYSVLTHLVKQWFNHTYGGEA
jgi:Mg2+-importing ATPase